MNVDSLDHPLEHLAWFAEPQRKLVQRLGIATWRHLLEHYPRRYEDRTRFAAFPTNSSEESICLRGIIQKVSAQYFGRRKIMEVTLEDLSSYGAERPRHLPMVQSALSAADVSWRVRN